MYYFTLEGIEQNFQCIEKCRAEAEKQGLNKFRCQNGGEYFL